MVSFRKDVPLTIWPLRAIHNTGYANAIRPCFYLSGLLPGLSVRSGKELLRSGSLLRPEMLQFGHTTHSATG